MFNPSQADVRRFFCGAYAKLRDAQPMDALERLAAQWIAEHPEYHGDLADAEAAVARLSQPDAARENPFLHLSMHLSISEQSFRPMPMAVAQRAMAAETADSVPVAAGENSYRVTVNVTFALEQ